MKIIAIWLDNHKGFKEELIIFDEYYDVTFKNKRLKVEKKGDNLIFPKNLTLSIVVGENGSGKSRLLSFLIEILLFSELYPSSMPRFFIVIENKKGLIVYKTVKIKEANIPQKFIYKGNQVVLKKLFKVLYLNSEFYNIKYLPDLIDKIFPRNWRKDDAIFLKRLSVNYIDVSSSKVGEILLLLLQKEEKLELSTFDFNPISFTPRYNEEENFWDKIKIFGRGSVWEGKDKSKNKIGENLSKYENFYFHHLLEFIQDRFRRIPVSFDNHSNEYTDPWNKLISGHFFYYVTQSIKHYLRFCNYFSGVINEYFEQTEEEFHEAEQSVITHWMTLEGMKDCMKFITNNKINYDEIKELCDKNIKLVELKEEDPLLVKINRYSKEKLIWLDFQDENSTNFSDLSYGQKFIYAQALNIFSHTVRSNSNLLVLLDEPDLALHPNWQRRFIDEMVNITSKISSNQTIQFIITTHSPFFLSDVPKENVVFLEDSKSLDKGLKPDTFGSNIHDLLANSFFMKNGLIGEFAKKKIQKAIDYTDKNKDKGNTDILEIEQIINNIGDKFLREQLWNMLYPQQEKQKRIKELLDELNRLQDD